VDPVFLAAALRLPPRILGVQLLPLSPAHLMVLEAAGSSFLLRGAGVASGDVAFFLYCCSRPGAEANLALQTDAGRRAFARFAFALRPRFWRRYSALEIDAAAANIREYLRQYLDQVPLCVAGDAPLVAPYQYCVAVGGMLASGGGIGWREACDMPVNLLACIAATAGDLRGARNLLNEAQRDTADALAAGVLRPQRKPEGEITDEDLRMQAELERRLAELPHG